MEVVICHCTCRSEPGSRARASLVLPPFYTHSNSDRCRYEMGPLTVQLVMAERTRLCLTDSKVNALTIMSHRSLQPLRDGYFVVPFTDALTVREIMKLILSREEIRTPIYMVILHSAKHLKSSFTYIVSFDPQNILELKMTLLVPLLVNTMMLMEVVA